MEVMTRPASPTPHRDLRPDSAAASPYATAPSSPRGRLAEPATPFGSVEGAAAAKGSPFLTAPSSPNPFDLLPPVTPRLAGANPFDLFQHFTSAPASPRRAAAIYAHFAEGDHGSRDGGEEEEEDDDDDDEGFHPRSSYSTTASAVPFDWEERPGTPKAGMGGGAAAWDTDFEFGTVVDKTAPAESLTTADELFEKGKIRPLKPLLKTSGTDFDPFAAALLVATKAPSPSPLGGKNTTAVASGSPPKKADPFAARPASRSAGWRRWRLSDLLLFRSSSEGGRINKEPLPKCPPAQQPDAPLKKANAPPPPTTAKFNARAVSMDKLKKQGGDKSGAAAAAEGIVGCARLSPLQRFARGLGGHSWHHGRGGMAAQGTKG
ncbi:unnamed protein product [Triticum turgidum subsp. durum]|uniref:Uncharacterized protein n=1 Tax=Triticum turgidum subsp. durum TaxID=4567 RepID=A0A9R0ZW37_TRITD|nr:unnamed protein product [Triticum turgidum subsp. durum]